MKRIIALLLALALAVFAAGCAKAPEETTATTVPPTTQPPTTQATEPPTTVPPTTQPPPTEPQWEPGTVRADGAAILYRLLERGEQVSVLGQWESWYIIAGEEANLLVNADFLRCSDETAPEGYSGWSRSGVEVYPTAHLAGDAVATLSLNTQVQVEDGKGNWLLVTWADGSGYVAAERISKSKISVAPPETKPPAQNQDGTDVDIGGLSASTEGGRVLLLESYHGPEFEKYAQPRAGLILTGSAEGYLTPLYRGEEVKVTQVGDTDCSVLIGELIGTLPRWALSMEGDPAYEAWNAYARSKTVSYTDCRLETELASFGYNDNLLVADCLEELELYVVELDGAFGYVPMAQLSETKLTPPSTSGSSGGSSGGGSESGWTPPAL